ncbi:hypothetical protein BJ166DRAFT_532073 [Pestalotiopsis sp. NC0098]|nr:hypothetical protein BJ166DRAFT_532073 [Pestalotiopsis sp. NC0098]
MADASARTAVLEGFPLSITIVISAFLIFAILSVGVRSYVRVVDNVFGVDDGLILAGLIVYITDIALAIRGVSVGIGSKNDHLNSWMQAEAEKYYIIWITLYVVTVALIKSSVCLTLARVAAKSNNSLRIAVWALLGLTWASFCVTFFGILTFCRPVEANWNTALVAEGKASCADTETLIAISHTNTASSIATDVGCMVLPGLLLWDANMGTRAKLQVFGLMSIASIASLTTISRAPFISRYRNPTDNLMYYIGYIVLLSMIEVGVGCTAACLPSTRAFYLRMAGKTKESPTSTPNAKSLVTIGGNVIGGSGRKKSNRGIFNKSITGRTTTTTCVSSGAGDWERLNEDGESGRSILNEQTGAIRTDYSYTVELESVTRKEDREIQQ